MNMRALRGLDYLESASTVLGSIRRARHGCVHVLWHFQALLKIVCPLVARDGGPTCIEDHRSSGSLSKLVVDTPSVPSASRRTCLDRKKQRSKGRQQSGTIPISVKSQVKLSALASRPPRAPAAESSHHVAPLMTGVFRTLFLFLPVAADDMLFKTWHGSRGP